MAIIDKFPAKSIVDGYAGIYDFYTCNGQTCVRSWPRKPRRSSAAIRTFENMRNMHKKWKSLHWKEIERWKQFAGSGPWTGRDCFAAMFMRGSQPRPLIYLRGIRRIGPRFRIVFTRDQGNVPMLRALPSDSPLMNSVRVWRGVEFPVCKAREMDSIRPTYFDHFLVNPNVGGGRIWFDIDLPVNYIFMQLLDPDGIREYCTPMYRYEVPPGPPPP